MAEEENKQTVWCHFCNSPLESDNIEPYFDFTSYQTRDVCKDKRNCCRPLECDCCGVKLRYGATTMCNFNVPHQICLQCKSYETKNGKVIPHGCKHCQWPLLFYNIDIDRNNNNKPISILIPRPAFPQDELVKLFAVHFRTKSKAVEDIESDNDYIDSFIEHCRKNGWTGDMRHYYQNTIIIWPEQNLSIKVRPRSTEQRIKAVTK